MKRHLLAGVLTLLCVGAVGYAEDPSAKPQTAAGTTKATFLITGLHCPRCTKTVESSLRKAKGIRSIKVDWKTKNASVEFDEAVVPAQKVAQLIADTPHMMGPNMHYAGRMTLRVPEMKDADSANEVKDALGKVPGVKKVTFYGDQPSIGVQFDGKGKLTSRELIDALQDAGFEASVF